MPFNESGRMASLSDLATRVVELSEQSSVVGQVALSHCNGNVTEAIVLLRAAANIMATACVANASPLAVQSMRLMMAVQDQDESAQRMVAEIKHASTVQDACGLTDAEQQLLSSTDNANSN